MTSSPEASEQRAAGSPPRPSRAVDPATWVERHGDVLYRYALLRLAKPDAAEEVVQETLLAALRAAERFAQTSSERTWLVGILKHKIVDRIREQVRSDRTTELSQVDEVVQDQFSRRGTWKTKPLAWGAGPGQSLEQQEFWDALVSCVGTLPPRLAEAFWLREVEDVPSDQVCKEMQLTPTNLWTLLHRARSRLRRCMEVNWFGRK